MSNPDAIAVKWLIYQHGKTAEEAAEIMSGIITPGSNWGRLRQEAADVAGFVEALNV